MEETRGLPEYAGKERKRWRHDVGDVIVYYGAAGRGGWRCIGQKTRGRRAVCVVVGGRRREEFGVEIGRANRIDVVRETRGDATCRETDYRVVGGTV